MGAITLNSVLCGLLYHPVEQHMKRIPITSEKCGVDNKALTLDESSADITQSTEENTKQLSIQSINSSDKTVPREKDRSRNNRNNDRGRSSSSSSSGKPNCWYHHKFGEKATKCKQPCSFSTKTNTNNNKNSGN